ncbi:glycosyltransferase family 1 protein [Paraflavisolibacter sp. H34]|uniref:glycosyltransferase family 4 protein n=1 Tax=Huijunlia imazamoxiresistens TaxID=3127457 RepID=UPI003017B6CE
MRVLFDHQIFLSYKFGGVARYHFKLYESLLRLKNQHAYEIVHFGTDNHYLDGEKKIIDFKGRKKVVGYINNRLVINRFKNVEVFHPTYYDTYFLGRKDVPAYVLTIHDMIPEWEYQSGNGVFKQLVDCKRQLLEKASAVIAISEATKKDISVFSRIDPAKITVIHHGEPDYFSKYSGMRQDYNPGEAYVLYVGYRDGYKNFKFALKGLASFLKKEPVSLKVVGKEVSREEKELISQLGLEHKVIFLRETSEDTLYSLYQQALCFIYPSLMEGFGIPILEAFYSGCPVICSDIDCFREVASDAALYFDPKSPESLNRTMEKVYSSREVRNELRKKGESRLRSFSWAHTAKATNGVYEAALNH